MRERASDEAAGGQERGGAATGAARPLWHGYVPALQGRWLTEAPEQSFAVTDASLLFADVSGFTALAERLAKRGKVGAEELNERINHVFTRLIAAVEALGGDVLKFGGDALLVHFDGDGHARRARAAGIAMQEAMERVRRDRAAGTGNLQVSIGVASGQCHLFLAGSPFRDLLLAGPLATSVVAAESIAAAGEVRAWDGPAPVTGSADGADCTRLVRTPSPVRPCGPPVRPHELDRDAAIPRHLHDLDPEPEHRSLAIAFVQARGLGAVLEAEGPEGLAEALDALVTATQASAERFGVTYMHSDVDSDAIKMILVAGAPTSAPDDDDRLVNAVRDAVGQASPFLLRAGVNRGRSFVANLGAPHRHVWTVLGDPVNLAARVMGKAEPGTVLATRSILGRLRDEFELTPVEPFRVKGKTDPVDAELVGAPRGSAARAASAAAEVFGRERELAVLREVLDSARSGDGGLVQLVGEPGIGKSTLVAALLDEATDVALAATIQAGPYSAFTPYRAVRDPLRAVLLGQAEGDQDELAEVLAARVEAAAPELLGLLPLIGVPLGLELPETEQSEAVDPRYVMTRTADAITRLIEAVLPPGAHLLVIEDGHWIDASSAEVLTHLIRRLREQGNMALLTRRPGGGGLDLSEEERVRLIELEPLDEGAARRLVASAGLPSKVAAEIIARSGGNPLYLRELLVAAAGGEDVEALPESIEGLITARIDTLPPQDRALLRQAAVLGNRAPVELLGALAGTDRINAALARLEGFITRLGPEMVGFRHALLRDAAYEALSYRRRRELHARAAELIAAGAGGGAVELLAIHHHAAGQWPQSWRASTEAGELAERHGAAKEAVRFYANALEAGKRMRTVPAGEIAAVAERLGDAATLAADYAMAAAGYGEARRRRREEPHALAELCRKEGRLRETSDRYPAALGWFTRGLRALQRAPSSHEVEALRAKLLVARGGTNWLQGRLRDAVPTLKDGAETAIFADDRRTLAHAYYLLDTVLSALGDPEARLYRDLALPIFEELGDHDALARALNNRGLGAYVEGRWGDAMAMYDRCRSECELIGDVDGVATAEYNIAEVLAAQGRLDEADDLLAETLAVWRASNFRVGLGVTWRLLGRTAAHRGELELSRERLDNARTELAEGGAKLHVVEVDANEAERLLLGAEHARALKLLGAVRADALELGAPPWMLAWVQRLAGLAKLQAGDAEAALTRFAECIEIAERAHVRHEKAFALEHIADAGGPEADARRAEAETIFEGLGIVSRPRFPRAT